MPAGAEEAETEKAPRDLTVGTGFPKALREGKRDVPSAGTRRVSQEQMLWKDRVES